MSSAIPDTRELAARESDGLHVLLLWHPREDALTVSVEDAHVRERFEIAVERDRALDAFNHPFAYAAAGAKRPNSETAASGSTDRPSRLSQR